MYGDSLALATETGLLDLLVESPLNGLHLRIVHHGCIEERKEYLLVDNQRWFKVTLALHDANGTIVTDQRIEVRPVLVYESCQPITRVDQGEPLLGLHKSAAGPATLINGTVTFKLILAALSSQHSHQRFRLRFEPTDAGYRNAYPNLTLHSVPLVSTTKAAWRSKQLALSGAAAPNAPPTPSAPADVRKGRTDAPDELLEVVASRDFPESPGTGDEAPCTPTGGTTGGAAAAAPAGANLSRVKQLEAQVESLKSELTCAVAHTRSTQMMIEEQRKQMLALTQANMTIMQQLKELRQAVVPPSVASEGRARRRAEAEEEELDLLPFLA